MKVMTVSVKQQETKLFSSQNENIWLKKSNAVLKKGTVSKKPGGKECEKQSKTVATSFVAMQLCIRGAMLK